MLVIGQDQLVARLGVGEADAARARPVGNPPHRAMLLERPVRHVKQRLEFDGGEPADGMILLRAEGRHRTAFLNKDALDYVSIPTHHYEAGSVDAEATILEDTERKT
jgi:hypothetical protein